VSEIASRLGVSRATILRRIKGGSLAAYRAGERKLMIPVSALESAIALHKAAGPSVEAVPDLFSDRVEIARGVLRSSLRLSEGAIDAGIEQILPPRRNSERTIIEVRHALEDSPREVLLQGVALREFFSDKGYTDVLNAWATEPQGHPVLVRAIMLNPASTAARARIFAEGGDDYRTTGASTDSQLFSDIRRSYVVIKQLIRKISGRAKSRLKIETAFVDFHPTAWCVMTNMVAFLEPYHLGASEDGPLATGLCIGELIPVFKVNSESPYYRLFRSSFEHVWNSRNPFIEVRRVNSSIDQMDQIFARKSRAS
jgi:excisionase family DNA binding protein